ncbi:MULTISPECIES: hypothetical protein [Ramlibacter]|uniref:Uncharacterized protein n=1 Tax=Ramlibacter pinisoli TaxID=2682844 RepID=A0A6N8IUJ8_9BURK|nr:MULTISPECIES: hypothetical protein [Ramlibacter]MBA2965408.1 hypothetical protein [Ramlibacter sp. CGMCC 1.13660]MVQ30372.1 hypothetical protein [Ramlibacter pinisoli]
MAKTKPKRPPVRLLEPPEVERAMERFRDAVQRFDGSFDELESAIGMYVLGHYVGWRVLVLMHSKATIRKYEQILGIVVREEFPETGPESDRSIAYTAAQALSNFWKIVSGEAKLDVPRDERKHFTS